MMRKTSFGLMADFKDVVGSSTDAGTDVFRDDLIGNLGDSAGGHLAGATLT